MSFDGKLASGQLYKEWMGEEADEFRRRWLLATDGVLKIEPGETVLPKQFLKCESDVYNLEWQPSDILVTSYPKSGTTWVQEIIWHLINDNTSADASQFEKYLALEGDMYFMRTKAPEPFGKSLEAFRKFYPGQDWRNGLRVKVMSAFPPPRMLKSHLPLNFFPPDIAERCKLLCVLRDPRDVICSLYHYSRLHYIYEFKGDFDEFINDFVEDTIPYGPHWHHQKMAWERRNDPNVCLIFYEDLKADSVKEIRRINKFIGTNKTEEQMQKIANLSSFDNMKEKTKDDPPTSNKWRNFNKKVVEEGGGFFRKGQVGDWKTCFTEDQIKKVNAWMIKNLKSFGPDFIYN